MPTTLAILAGGRGSRMGFPKSHLAIDGQPILTYLLDRLNWPGPTLLVTAPACARPPGWDRFDSEISDPLDDQGPLQGIATALRSAATESVLFIPVDMPRLRREPLDWMLNALGDAAGLMCARGGNIEPLPCVLRASLLPAIELRLVARRRSIYSLAEEPGMKTVPAPLHWREDFWMNLNTPEDLKEIP